MAVGLNRLFGPAPGWRRRAAWVALVLGVAIVHSCVTLGVAERMVDLSTESAMPARIEVAYVREMASATPPSMVAAPPQAEAAPVPRAKPAKAVKPAKAASAPETRPEPVEPARAAVNEPAAPPETTTEAVAVLPTAPSASEPMPVSVAEAASPPAPAASGATAFVWPASTRISYELTGNFRGEVNGSAQVEWIRAGSRYQVHVDLIIGPSFAPILSRRMSSDGELTVAGLAPRRYDEDSKVMLRERRRRTMSFEPGVVVLANGDRRASVPGVQDQASQFVQLTYVFSTRPELLGTGGTVDIPLALPHRVGVWTYDVAGEDVLATPFGALPAVHLRPRRAAPQAGEYGIEFWFAPELRYLPVRIRIEQDTSTYIDLLISKRPEMGG